MCKQRTYNVFKPTKLPSCVGNVPPNLERTIVLKKKKKIISRLEQTGVSANTTNKDVRALSSPKVVDKYPSSEL
jgi:hypothetical protein